VKSIIFNLNGIDGCISVTYAGYQMFVRDSLVKLLLLSGSYSQINQMRPWFSFLRWINMIFYSFEGLSELRCGIIVGCSPLGAVVTNEFAGQNFACVPPRLLPYGPGYENGPAGCAFEGSTLGSTSISGDNYLHVALGFERSQ